jgi:hypothetical protein
VIVAVLIEFSGKYCVVAVQYREASDIRELLLRDVLHQFYEYL